jgi:hypothetical protein
MKYDFVLIETKETYGGTNPKARCAGTCVCQGGDSICGNYMGRFEITTDGKLKTYAVCSGIRKTVR